MYKLPATLLLILFSFFAKAATLTGLVADEDKKPLAFASVYIKGTTTGVTTNPDGIYTLQLEPGNYEIIFQYVGYEKRTEQVTIGNVNVTLNVALKKQNFQIKDVTVYADAEDPAYRIIRNTIKLRKQHLSPVDAYSCGTYVKSVIAFDSIPSTILGMPLPMDSNQAKEAKGIQYLSESESDYYVKAPDNVKEVMISSKVSGDSQGFSWNTAQAFGFNFYNNLLQGLGTRGFVSPISESALFYYKYELIGTFMEDGQLVNKIRVIPKRAHDPVFSGYIYIIENLWVIHSVDVLLDKNANIDFIDSVRIKMNYARVADTIWMPFNQSYLLAISIFGIKANGYFLGVFNKYNLSPVFTKGFFNNEVIKIDEAANKKDSLYWANNRPIPLSKKEDRVYVKKDSLEKIYTSKEYLDSIDRKSNKFNPLGVMSGYTYTRSFKKKVISVSGVEGFVNYNTVEGFAPVITVSYDKRWDNFRRLGDTTNIRYGNGNKIFSMNSALTWYSGPVSHTKWKIEGGSYPMQFNESEPIHPFMNTLYTVLWKENYMKIYQRHYGKLSMETEITNGIVLSPTVGYGVVSPLKNTSNWTLKEKSSKEFTTNYPYGDTLNSNFKEYQSLVAGISATFTFGQKYITYPGRKIKLGSKYPTLTLSYRKGIKALASDVDFDQVEAVITDKLSLGLLGTSTYRISGGYFLNNKAVGIAELKHFNGNQTIFIPFNTLVAYNLLPYYQFSTNDYYVEGHYEHHFGGFIMNKIPLIRKLKLHEVGSVHYLYTNAINYTEFSVGLEHILKFFRVDFAVSYSNQLKVKSRFMIGASTEF